MISRFILKLFGWKSISTFPDYDKIIVIIAPHTSMMDFVIGKLYYGSVGRKPHFIIKKEMFIFPLGYLLKWAGGIPVDRHNAVSIIDQVVERISISKKIVLNITPEGTRKKVKKWKRGFYEITLKTGLPLAVGMIDYKKKEIGVMTLFKVTGDYQKDIKEIKSYYVGKTGRYPERFDL